MEAVKILHELTYAEGLPKEALMAASAQREEMLPLFIEEIEAFLALAAGARAKPTPLFFIFHVRVSGERRQLTGSWRGCSESLALRSIGSSTTGLPQPATASWRRYSTVTLSRSTTSS